MIKRVLFSIIIGLTYFAAHAQQTYYEQAYSNIEDMLSCKTGLKFNENIIDCISNESAFLPSQFLNYTFFCKGSDNKILIFGVYDLQRIHEDSYNQMSYKSFLTKALNQNLLISKPSPKAFDLNKEVQHDYNNNKFEDFINKYCEKHNDDSYTLKTKNCEYISSILYYCFINNYLSIFDDYSGAYKILKVDKWECK